MKRLDDTFRSPGSWPSGPPAAWPAFF